MNVFKAIMFGLLCSGVGYGVDDQYGDQHNRLVLCVKSQSTRNLTIERVMRIAATQCGLDKSILRMTQSLVDLAPPSCQNPSSDEPGIEELADDRRYGLSDQHLRWLTTMEGILQNNRPSDAIKKLEQLQKQAKRSLNMDDVHEAAVFMGLDIALHSARLWTRGPIQLPFLAKWGQVVLGDAVGGVVGGIFGGGVGAVGLGTACSTLIAEKT